MFNAESNCSEEGFGTESKGTKHLNNDGALGVRIIVEELVTAHHHFQTAEKVLRVAVVCVE